MTDFQDGAAFIYWQFKTYFLYYDLEPELALLLAQLRWLQIYILLAKQSN